MLGLCLDLALVVDCGQSNSCHGVVKTEMVVCL